MMNSATAVAAAPSRLSAPFAAQWLLLALPVLLLIALLWPVLHDIWMTSSTYSHGYLVLAIAGWLAWREVQREPLSLGRPSWLGLGFLLAVAFGAVLARTIDVRLVQQLAIPALLVGALWAGGGWRFAQRFIVPAGYIVFAMSIWGYLQEPLRQITTVAVGAAARMTGIPVYIVGNSIHIPAGTFEVEGGCSGLNYVVVGLALGAISALMRYSRWVPRLLFFGVIAAISVVANWVRVYAIVIAGHLTEMQHFLVRVDHYYFGWVLFLIMVVPVLVWAARQPSTNAEPEEHASGPATAAGPLQQRGFGLRALIAPIAAVAIALLAGLVLASGRVPAGPGVFPVQSLPASVAGWQLEGEWQGSTRPLFHNPPVELSGRYTSNGRELLAYAVGYPVQRQGAELIYYANMPIPDRDIVEAVEGTRVVAGSEEYAVTSYRLRDRDGLRRVAWTLYRVAGFSARSDWSGTALQALGALIGRRDGQAIVLSASCAESCDAALADLREAAPHFIPLLLEAADPNLDSNQPPGQ